MFYFPNEAAWLRRRCGILTSHSCTSTDINYRQTYDQAGGWQTAAEATQGALSPDEAQGKVRTEMALITALQ